MKLYFVETLSLVNTKMFLGLSALLQHSSDISADTGVSMLVCFDHEEIGSASAQGAFSAGGSS